MYRMTTARVSAWVVMVVCSAGAGAQPVPADKAVKYRQAAFTQMGAHMTRLNAAIKGDAPSDKASLELSADVVELMGRVAFEGFVPGGDQTGSKAQPEVWRELPKFRELAKAMQAESLKLKAAARTGDLSQVKTAFQGVAKACKACHDPYLAK
jgi:cytochrome c556